MALVVRVPPIIVGGVALAVIAGHNLTDGVPRRRLAWVRYGTLHAWFPLARRNSWRIRAVGGVMALGYAIAGGRLRSAKAARVRLAVGGRCAVPCCAG
jgi:hypothetical protein